MPKQIKEDKNVLALGDVRKDIVKEEKRKKRLIFPIILIIIGISLMFTGIFFNKIISILNISNLLQRIEKSHIKKNIDSNTINLQCSKESDDETSGINTKIEYKFTFNNENKLQSLIEKRILTPIKYSEIGYDNIKIVDKEYKKIVNQFENINGISIVSKLRKEELVISIDYDYLNIDKSQIPNNDYVNVVQDSTQTYKTVKKDMITKYDTICVEN